MIKNDIWIDQKAKEGMIDPYVPHQVRSVKDNAYMSEGSEREVYKKISYGLSSYGYDIRLSPKEFLVFERIAGEIVDPKNFNEKHLVKSDLYEGENGFYFILPANSYGLGVSIEELQIPENILVLCIGKSTYARAGIICNITPVEPMWKGHLTIEISNSSSADCKVYANEGIIQLLFLEGETPQLNYEQRNGKYQNQPHQVITPKL